MLGRRAGGTAAPGLPAREDVRAWMVADGALTYTDPGEPGSSRAQLLPDVEACWLAAHGWPAALVERYRLQAKSGTAASAVEVPAYASPVAS